MKHTTIGLTAWLWALGLWVGSCWAQLPELPFHFEAVCATDSDNDNDAGTTTTNTNHNSSSSNFTALLLYDAWPTSTSSPSPCQCNISGDASFNVTILWRAGHATVTTLDHHNCTWEADGEERDNCRRGGSPSQPLTLRLDAQVVEGKGIGGHGGGEGQRRRRRKRRERTKRVVDREVMKDKGVGGQGGGYVLLVVQATETGPVHITCRNETKNDTATSAAPSSPATTSSVKQTNVSHTAATTAATTTTTNNITTTTPVKDGVDSKKTTKQPAASSTTAQAISNETLVASTPEMTLTSGTAASAAGQGTGGSHRQDEPKGITEFAVLGVGVGCIVIAPVIALVIILKLRSRTKGEDVEINPPSHEERKSSNTNTNTTTSDNNNDSSKKNQKKKKKKSKAAATTTTTTTTINNSSANTKGGSHDSLINDNHNYEEVTDDGLGSVAAGAGERERKISRPGIGAPGERKISRPGVGAPGERKISQPGVGAPGERKISQPGVGTTGQRERKISKHTLPPSTDYSHIKVQTSVSVNDDDDDDDDYNHLDRVRSSRGGSMDVKTKSSAPAKKFYVGDEDDDYMDMENDDGGDDDDDHNDIYEAVDGETTPLCSRRGAERRQEYTDCMSGEDGSILISDGKVNYTNDAKRLRTSKPADATAKTPVDHRPSLPLSPPLKANNGRMDSLAQDKSPGRGLHRSSSRSLDNVARLKFQGQGHHKHSKSVDLNSPILQNFRSQGDGAESEDIPSQPEDSLYSDVMSEDNPRRCNTHDKRPDIPANPPPKGHSVTSPLSKVHSPNPSPDPEQPNGNAAPVMLRRKSRNSKKKKVDEGEGEGRVSMVDYLKELNTGLLELETAVRHSMEIKDEELVMIDNVLYGTLPRNLSLPTTEL